MWSCSLKNELWNETEWILAILAMAGWNGIICEVCKVSPDQSCPTLRDGAHPHFLAEGASAAQRGFRKIVYKKKQCKNECGNWYRVTKSLTIPDMTFQTVLGTVRARKADKCFHSMGLQRRGHRIDYFFQALPQKYAITQVECVERVLK